MHYSTIEWLKADNLRAYNVLTQFEETFGFNPEGIFCLVTGKQIGRTESDELIALIDSLSGDTEEIVDDLAMRLFASMRPSMRWNKMRTDSLDDMRKIAPHETLAYLLNRLLMPVDNRYDYLVAHGERIKLFSALSKLPASDTLNQAIHLLLEIDARLGLKALTATFTCDSLIAKLTSWDSLVAFLTPWHTQCLAKYEKQLSESAYMTANPLAKTAFFRSFMESKPVSPAMQRKAERSAESRFFESIFEELVGESTKAIPKSHVPAVKVEPAAATLASTKMPLAWLSRKA